MINRLLYRGSADRAPKENVNKYVGSSWLHKRECLNIVFWSNLEAFNSFKISALTPVCERVA